MRTPHAHHPRNAERTLRRRLASASLQAPLDARQGEVIRGDRLGVGDAAGADGLLHLLRTQAQHFEELALVLLLPLAVGSAGASTSDPFFEPLPVVLRVCENFQEMLLV